MKEIICIIGCCFAGAFLAGFVRDSSSLFARLQKSYVEHSEHTVDAARNADIIRLAQQLPK
jgi:hypothetical protein